MSLFQSPLHHPHPPFYPRVNPVLYSSCRIISALEEKYEMPGKGGIAASVDGQLALSEGEVDAQKMVVVFVVAFASAAFSSPLVWQYVTLWVKQQQRICFSLCRNRLNKDPCLLPNLPAILHKIPSETCGTCCTSVRGCTEVIASRPENVQRPMLSSGLLLHFE